MDWISNFESQSYSRIHTHQNQSQRIKELESVPWDIASRELIATSALMALGRFPKIVFPKSKRRINFHIVEFFVFWKNNIHKL